jgi:ATP-dependent RNA helicase RhlE
LREQDYTQPTPIQQKAIPPLLAGRDLLGAAQTGTGKTAAFALPLLQLMSAESGAAPQAIAAPEPAGLSPRSGGAARGRGGRDTPRRPVRALVLVPTRELAIQVETSVRTYGKYLSLRSAAIYGGVGMQPQIDALRRGVDIVVATPGRLLDHLSQKTLSLANVDRVVLDEADRMLDMGFIHDVRRILAVLPRDRQTLLFSATFSAEVRQLADSFLRNPVSVQATAPNTTVALVRQSAHLVPQDSKRSMLVHILRQKDWPQVLIFTRTKHGANRLAEQLSDSGIAADAIHGNKSQGQRIRALERFKSGQVRVLVATDIAARGIDIIELPCVMNYDMPHVAEDYVHRIGRTARAGASGEAVSLVSRDDQPLLSAVEHLIKQKIERCPVEGFVAAASEREQGEPSSAARRTPPQRRGSAPSSRNGAAPARKSATPARNGARRQGGPRQEARAEGGAGRAAKDSRPGAAAAQRRPPKTSQARSGEQRGRSAPTAQPQQDQRQPAAAERSSSPAARRSGPVAMLLRAFGSRSAEAE